MNPHIIRPGHVCCIHQSIYRGYLLILLENRISFHKWLKEIDNTHLHLCAVNACTVSYLYNAVFLRSRV